MAASTSTALTKRSADTALMPPPPPPVKRQKRPRKVLDEDVYHQAVSHIIARDFFPGLLENDAQHEYMEALESNDNDWIRDAGRRLVQVMTPLPEGQRRSRGRGTSFTPRRSAMLGDTPRDFSGETPVRTPMTANRDFAPEEEKKMDVDTNMSLGAFQAKYTSEDNESFNALLDKQNGKRADKYAFFHQGNKIPSARQIAYREREQKLLESGNTSNALITTNNSEASSQNNLEPQQRLSQDLDARPASKDSFPNRQGPRNHFMFGPDGVEDYLTTPAQEAQERSNAPPKSIKHAATRFRPTSTAEESPIPGSPSLSAIDAAIAGRPKPTSSEAGYTGAETPRINGYAFVDAEPTPSELGTPVTEEEADEAERAAAMKFLPQLEEGGGRSSFVLRERSKREDLLHRLVEKADVARRKEKGGSGNGAGDRLGMLRALGVTSATPGTAAGTGRTPTPRFTGAPSVAAGGGKTGMTPAAQRLAERIGTPRREGKFLGGGGGDGAGKGKSKVDWTPTPRAPKGKK